jgi:hypothetical protein
MHKIFSCFLWKCSRAGRLQEAIAEIGMQINCQGLRKYQQQTLYSYSSCSIFNLHPLFKKLKQAYARLLEEPSLAATLKGVYFIYILLSLRVSTLIGHLQAE